MIHFLKGFVEETGDDFLALEVKGVGYKVYCPARTLARLNTGDSIKLHTHLHVSEAAGQVLYGFSNPADRDMFDMLISVNGVGRKVALAILSALEVEDVFDAISNRDGKTICRANGVGPKLGERVVRELSDKVGALPMADGAKIIRQSDNNVMSDVASALENLGYKPQQAHQAIQQALETVGPEADFNSLFKASLSRLA